MAAHAAWLLDVGNGTHHRSEGLPADVIGIPDNMAAPTEDVNDLIDTIFPDLAAKLHAPPRLVYQKCSLQRSADKLNCSLQLLMLH